MDRRFLEYLKKAEYEFAEYRDLSDLSYIGIGAVARYLVYPDSAEKLINLIKTIRDFSTPYVVIGRMSNLLFKGNAYAGVVIKTDKINGKYVAEDVAKLECGCTLPPVARCLAQCDFGGFEGLLGIPGSIGGMLRQNAGAFGYEIADRLICAEIYDSTRDARSSLSRDDMRFGYRASLLQNKNLTLLSATFKAIPKPKEVFFEEVKRYSEVRRKTQPVKEHSLGSVFKRANGVGAGYYIDLLGLKGLSVGGASVSGKHAGFIVNTGSATSDDVLRLIDIIKSKVFSEFGIALEEEIEII